MQGNSKFIPKTNNLSEKLFLFLKIFLFLSVLTGIVYSFQQKHQSIDNLILEYKKAFNSTNFWLLLTLIVLTFANWGFEALKWQKLASPITKFSFSEAYQSVIIGLSLSFITPANLGDFAGRIWKLNSPNRFQGVGAILMGNGIQFYVTLFFGTIAFGHFILHQLPQIPLLFCIFFLLLIASLLFGIFFYSRRHWIGLFFQKVKFLKRFASYFEIFETYNLSEILEILLWATLRYLTFSIQFIIVLLIFSINLPLLELFTLTSLVFFFKTLIPSFNFLSDLGIREFTALYFFSYYAIPPAAVVSATLSLWLINILTPVLFGMVFIVKEKKK
ncbi:Uncharacterized membrane protein YbhN, UPF0104 family [Pseudarcicella hirudinis]|uniref:Uncharacterized membrane protein YbhN, UPF0104 family n=1 Tax=Pseudarcicella hirudinis TaxID=1079859 RepID=A0A1I5Y1K1_9BACT|nr:Uncharacterized membrane protein YbhN, UPF0104 family [Pseudarcicella hirudinis]